ncbi:phage tail tape measure protein [Acetatifactor muris]|uniref:Phage-related minor tail protein n=1 Tax=Acetatifactor muris TaxID=879566 RepID=A0A2K4ZHW6_9FIRM|nr:phage tail tape measure protein [Acetatifactor muris]MCR2048186.1 phage tail tape measure protein [Acetatifactor muris]SOY30051.1 Phage-related minor tail protein [Acetatifactor muris]
MAAGGGKEMEIAIKIAGKVESSFKSALSQATKGLGTITKTVASATAAAAAAVGAMGIAAINTGREFEGAMSQVAATMLIDKTTAEGQKAFETLENAARECGASTAFSATEAAEALNYLALAGYDADKAATALPTVLKLAGAGAMDLAAASDMVTDSMSALGIEATEANLTQFSDQLAQTASKANTSVAQLGEAILTVGGTAKGLAGGTTELNTALGILADNGLKGAEGGTHLRNIILSLQNPTDKAAASLKSLGVDVYDAQGNMRGLNDVFKDLQGAMAGMDNASKDSILSTLFNKTDLTAANAMLSNCTDRFDELSAAVENSAGACENMYAIQLDNLNGDIDILKSGLSDLGISIYQDLNGPLREMTQLATSMVGELSEAYKSGGMEGMVGAVGGCMAEVVNTIADYAPQVVSMGVDLLENFISGITDNSGTLAAAAADVGAVFINGLFSLVPQVILAGIDIIVQLAQSITAQLPQLINNGTQAIVNFVSGIIQRLPEVISTALTLVQTLVNSIGQNAPMLTNAAIQLIGNLVLGIVSMLPQLIQMGIQLILSLVQGIIANLPQLLQMGVQIIISLVSGITQMLPMLIQGGIQLIISLIQGIIANLGNIVQAAVQIVITLAAGLIQAIPQLIAAIPQLVGAIIDTILNTNWLDVGIQIIKGLIDGILSTGKSLWSAIKSLFTGGEVDIPDTSSQSAAVVNSYASGISSNAGTVTAAANSMATNAFSTMDTTGATAAGTQAGTAFSTGLTESMAAGGLDTAAFSANMTSMGTDGAAALNTSLTAGLATPIDTSGLLDAGAINTSMTAAGTDGAAALTLGLNTGLSGATINTGALAVDTSGLTTTMTAAGTDGAAAIGTGMTGNSQAVTQAATTLGTDINTALDSGWQKANTNAQTAMQRLATTVTDAARSAASAVKAAFENMTITIPKPRIPVISVSTNSVSYGDGGSVSVPQFSVNWNALGGIIDQPTIFNTSAGMQGVGEAGPEAILPLDTLWAKMKEILNEAIAASGGASLIDAFIEKLKGIGTGGGGQGTPELAGAGGPTIQYSPVYNLYGSAGKDEIAEADKLSQAEFNKLMKQYERDQQRRKL